MPDSSEQLLVERDGCVVTVTLNRPEVMNAMTAALFVDFGDLCRDLNRDETVRAVVVTGAGGNFCSGADVGPQAARATGTTPVVPLRNMRRIKESAIALHEL
ncbi:MAG: enoyl-CoA hydratase/isomerase family protein, partial [Acidimicrobiales bacterium]